MKEELRKQIIDILRMKFPLEYTKSIKYSADEILALGWYPKEFVEWMGLNTMTDRIAKNQVKYMTTNFDSSADWLTLDELYEYWKNLPK